MENTAPRKTAKFYRDIFNGNIYKAISYLPEVIEKFGDRQHGKYSKHNDRIRLSEYTEFNWNHQIEGFFLDDKGEVYASIYWQGDSTDGTTSIKASQLVCGRTIPAEHEWLGDRTYYTHGDLRIGAQEFGEAVRAVAKFLAPEEIKARKVAKERSEKRSAIFNAIDAKREKISRFNMEGFWNGRMAVQKLFENEPEIIDRPMQEVMDIAFKVWDNNNRSTYSLRGGYYGGEIKYNLNY